jgi:uncharacterized protein (TIGR03089 family)
VPPGSSARAPVAPARLLDDALSTDGARPFLTWYDDPSGERVELSVATFATWVAKTAGLLVDGLGAAPGDVVRLAAPPDHWQSLVWVVAAWRAGCVLDPYPRAAGDRAEVVVTGPERLAGQGEWSSGDDVVALSLRPLGAPFAPGALPPGALDYAREVPAYPDRFVAPHAAPQDTAARDRAGAALDGVELVARAGALASGWAATTGARLLVPSGPDRPTDPLDLVLSGTLVPLVAQGSVVVCRGPQPPPAGRVEQERITAYAGNPGPRNGVEPLGDGA